MHICLEDIDYILGESGIIDFKNEHGGNEDWIGLQQNLDSSDRINVIVRPDKIHTFENVQYIFIRDEKFKFCPESWLRKKIITNRYYFCIVDVFNGLKDSNKPVLEMKIISKLIKAGSFYKQINLECMKISKLIVEHSNDIKFNLSDLCDEVYMSKRKVQYILSDNKTSFKDLLLNARVKKLKNAINVGTSKSLGVLVQECGFGSLNSANKAFHNYFGLSVSEYKKSKELVIHT